MHPALLAFALALGSPPPPPAFHREIWATSMEPQRITGRSERKDRYLNTLDHGAALPDRSALGRHVEVRYPATGKAVVVTVVDVGPWNTRDPYWRVAGRRPAAETEGIDEKGRRTNRAGIDLSYGAWLSLGAPADRVLAGTHSGFVDWRFLPDQPED